MRQYMTDEGRTWENDKMVEDGSFAVSVEQMLRSGTQLNSGEEGGVEELKSLLTLTVPEEKPFSICLWLESSWK